MPTPSTPIRFTDADRAKIDTIKADQGLNSRAEAVRWAINAAFKKINAGRKKSGKTP